MNDSVGHERVVCRHCKKVISQCRCMDCNKAVREAVCDQCLQLPENLKGRFTLHNIFCIEANVMDCEESERLEKLVKLWVKNKLSTLIKDRYLTTNNLPRQLGWVEGHKKAIEEAIEAVEESDG